MTHIVLHTSCKLLEIFEFKEMKDGDLAGTPCIFDADNMTQEIVKKISIEFHNNFLSFFFFLFSALTFSTLFFHPSF